MCLGSWVNCSGNKSWDKQTRANQLWVPYKRMGLLTEHIDFRRNLSKQREKRLIHSVFLLHSRLIALENESLLNSLRRKPLETHLWLAFGHTITGKRTEKRNGCWLSTTLCDALYRGLQPILPAGGRWSEHKTLPDCIVHIGRITTARLYCPCW